MYVDIFKKNISHKQAIWFLYVNVDENQRRNSFSLFSSPLPSEII